MKDLRRTICWFIKFLHYHVILSPMRWFYLLCFFNILKYNCKDNSLVWSVGRWAISVPADFWSSFLHHFTSRFPMFFPAIIPFHSPLSSSFLSRSCLLTVGCCFLLLLLLSLFMVHVIWGLGVVMHTSDFGRLYKSSWCVLLLGFANGCLVDIFEALMFVIGFCALFI